MSVAMETLVFLFLLSFSGLCLSDDTVAEDISPRQLERLVQLLTIRECEEFFSIISQPEEDIFEHLEELSEERNQLFPSRKRRDAYEKNSCRSELKDWLQIHGEEIYYDRLSRALQKIGRTDIAIEVGKNINQDKTLALEKYVEGYHQLVNQMTSQLENHHPDAHLENSEQEVLQLSAKQARGFSWKDFDLVVVRKPLPPDQRHLFHRAWPLIFGLLVGFYSALLCCDIIRNVLQRNALSCEVCYLDYTHPRYPWPHEDISAMKHLTEHNDSNLFPPSRLLPLSCQCFDCVKAKAVLEFSLAAVALTI
ncbi:hypothetical protein DNTS_004833 [Danionella cerebrum]|uniref:Death domain-containing protein n=1 Tax=Danionella cerebrum TaxID=2873325 RepID=A0A553QZN9_9TELE|nr:hypothetical protein DNTS_004833 [Danionella translucida]